MLTLNLNDDQHLDEPTADQISDGLSGLSDDQYAILSREDEDYIQVYRHAADDFQLEYRAGSENEHYGAATAPTDVETVKQAFAAYASGAADWQAAWEWQKMDI